MSLDLRHQCGVLDLARERARAGWAVFAVVHDLHLALRAADGVIMLDAGTVVARGDPSETLSPERIRLVFGVTMRRCDSGRPRLIVEGRGDPAGDDPPDPMERPHCP